MIRVKVFANGDIAIFDEGMGYLFDRTGRLIQENLPKIPKYTDGLSNLPIVSVLSSSGSAEVAVFVNDNMEILPSSTPVSSLVLNIQKIGGFLRMLTRTGVKDGVNYNQMVFIYRAEINPLQLLKGKI